MIHFNPDLAYVLPPKQNQPTQTRPNNTPLLRELNRLVQEYCMPGESFDLNRHIGPNSTYALKTQLNNALEFIQASLLNPQTSADDKRAIATKLIERAPLCSAGFHTGVNNILLSFDRPESFAALLYRIRWDIVAKTANQYDQYRDNDGTVLNNVHLNDLFFHIAKELRYGVHPINADDPYLASFRGHRQRIQEKLDRAFTQDYQPFLVMQALEDEIKSQLFQLRSDDADVQNSLTSPECIQFLSKIFKNTPAVIQQNEAIQRHQNLKIEYDNRIKAFLDAKKIEIQNFIPALKNIHFIHALITNNHRALPTPLLQSHLKHEGIIRIQAEYQQYLTSISLLASQIRDAQLQSTSPFLNRNNEDDDTVSLHWNNIGYAIRNELLRENYLSLSQDEQNALDRIFNAHLVPMDDYSHLCLNNADIIALASMHGLRDSNKNQLLHWYFLKGQYTPEEKRLTITRIQTIDRQNTMIRSATNPLISDIGFLLSPIRTLWMDKLRNPSISFDYTTIPLYLYHDPVFMLNASSHDAKVMRHAPAELKGPKECIIPFIQRNGLILEYASTELQNDPEVVSIAALQNINALQYAAKALLTNEDYMLSLIEKHAGAMQFAPVEWRDDDEKMLICIMRNGLALQYASERLREYEGIVEQAVMKNGLALEFAGEQWQGCDAIVLMALMQNGLALQYVAHPLYENEELVLIAVKQNGLALEHALRSFKNNKSIIIAAVSQNPEALKYASKALQQDPFIKLIANIQHANAHIDTSLLDPIRAEWLSKMEQPDFDYETIPSYLYHDRTFILAAITQHPEVLLHTSSALKNNKPFMIELMQHNGLALGYAPIVARQDPDIVSAAALQNITALESAAARLKHAKPFMLSMVQKNGLALQYALAILKQDPELIEAAELQIATARMLPALQHFNLFQPQGNERPPEGPQENPNASPR